MGLGPIGARPGPFPPSPVPLRASPVPIPSPCQILPSPDTPPLENSANLEEPGIRPVGRNGDGSSLRGSGDTWHRASDRTWHRMGGGRGSSGIGHRNGNDDGWKDDGRMGEDANDKDPQASSPRGPVVLGERV